MAGAAEVVEAALVVVLETAAAEALAAVEEALAVAALVAVALEAAKAALSAACRDTPRPCPDQICPMAPLVATALDAAPMAAEAALPAALEVALEAAEAALCAARKDTPRPCPDRICPMALVEAVEVLAAVAIRHHLHRDSAVHTRAIDRLQAARAPPGPRRPSQNARRTWSPWGGR